MFTWFYNLSTRMKLTIMSGLFIAIILILSVVSFMATMQAVSASKNIESILNRSFTRVTTLQERVERFDKHTLSFLGDFKNTDPLKASTYLSEAGSIINEVAEAASVMNPGKIGDLDSSPEYQQIINAYKAEASKLPDLFRRLSQALQKSDKQQALALYLNELRPQIMHAIEYTQKTLALQTKLVVELAGEGSDTSVAMTSLVVSFIAAITGAGIAFGTSQYLGNCVERLHSYVSKMGAGEFTFRVGSYHKDDFGAIIKNIENMRGELNKALGEVKERSNETETAMRNVIDNAGVMTNQISDCESKAITVSAASEEMLSTTQAIARSCEDASKLSQETKDIIDKGVDRINDTISSIRQQSQDIRANSEAVDKVAKRSMDINSIVNTIEEIAAQTNLLALNAAIEAARAGEAGRGFAVVADEVRALALRTSDSTKEIADMVQGIQTDSATAVRSINQSVVNMENTSQETAEVENTMRDMLDHINNVNMQIAQIASAAEEQTAATNEISMHIQGISDLSREVNSNAQGSVAIIDSTAHSMQSLRKSLSFFKTE